MAEDWPRALGVWAGDSMSLGPDEVKILHAQKAAVWHNNAVVRFPLIAVWPESGIWLGRPADTAFGGRRIDSNFVPTVVA